MADYLVQEDGTSKLTLEDASGSLLLEIQSSIAPGFIASVTAVYAPSFNVTVPMPFIIAGRQDTFPISEDFLGNPSEYESGAGQGYDDFTLAFEKSIPAVYPPELPEVHADFIASRTVVYSPSVPEVQADFIPSATTLYAPTVAYTNDVAVTAAGTYLWLCPPGVFTVAVECFGGGGPGAHGGATQAGGGGGGGAFARGNMVPVTPGTVYTFVVGGQSGDSSFTGDSGNQVVAKGGAAGAVPTHGAGGTAASSTGDIKFSGGGGGDGYTGAGNKDAGGGGASGNIVADGNSGASGTSGGGGAGGAGANGGGSGGAGGIQGTDNAVTGSSPGGGGGGGGGVTGGEPGKAGADGKVLISLGVRPLFISSVTVVFTPSLPEVIVPFVGSNTAAYAPTLTGAADHVDPSFISSRTHVWAIFSEFDPNKTYAGPGNGGESFLIRLNANGVTDTATLAANISSSATALELTGDGSFPSSEPFVVTIDSEILYVVQVAPGSYRIRGRGMSNTTKASHTAGATVSWGDSYEMPLRVTDPIAGSFTADINSTGSHTYPGWLVAFDSTQAYLSGSRYRLNVAELLGVFDAGAGSGGTNKCDAAQPSAVSTAAGTSDRCSAGLTNPSRIQTDIDIGDVAVLRYTNPEASVLDLGPRSSAVQSWFGLKRVDASDADVTFTDPTGFVVDTTGATGTYTGSVEEDYPEPLPLQTGIAPDASDAAGFAIDTPNTVPWETVTLPGSDRYFTYGPPNFSEKGWPFGVITVRQGNRRIPHWRSWDWHNFSYVYAGFGVDDSFAQIVINRNGIVFGSVPVVDLPGPQDIDGPDAVWDDATYYFAVCWYVAIFSGPYLVAGPVIGGSQPPPGQTHPPTPVVGFPPSGGGTSPGPPGVTVPPIEGGGGGGIDGTPVNNQLFQAAHV